MERWKRALVLGLCCSMMLVTSLLPAVSGASSAAYEAGKVEKVQTGTTWSGSPYVVMDSQGNAIALWIQINIDPKDLEVLGLELCTNRYEASSGWGTTTVLYQGRSVQYGIAMNPQGDAVAAWFGQGLDDDRSLYMSSYVNGRGWDGPQIIYVGAVHPMDIQVAVGSDGCYAIAWSGLNNSDPTGPLSDMFVYRSVLGSAGEVVSLPNEYSAYLPSMSLGPTGNLTIAWVGGGDVMVCASRYVMGSGWEEMKKMEGTPFIYGLVSTQGPEVVQNSVGDALVVWSRDLNGDSGLFACTYSTTGGWGKAIQLQGGQEISEYQSVLADDGIGAVAWVQSGPSYCSVSEVTLNPSTGWNVPLEVRNGTSGKEYLDALMEHDGNLAVLWTEASALDQRLYQCHIDLASQNRSMMSTHLPHLAEGLRDSAACPDGSIMYVWAGTTGERLGVVNITNIYSSRLSSSLQIGEQMALEQEGDRTIIAVSSVMATVLALGVIYAIRNQGRP